MISYDLLISAMAATLTVATLALFIHVLFTKQIKSWPLDEEAEVDDEEQTIADRLGRIPDVTEIHVGDVQPELTIPHEEE